MLQFIDEHRENIRVATDSGRLMHTTSISLLERVRRLEEHAAWDQFVTLYTPLLYYWTCRLGMKETDAADLIQDVFTVLLEKLPAFQYDAGKSFRAWLRTITYNKWRDLQRRRLSVGARRHEAQPRAG